MYVRVAAAARPSFWALALFTLLLHFVRARFSFIFLPSVFFFAAGWLAVGLYSLRLSVSVLVSFRFWFRFVSVLVWFGLVSVRLVSFRFLL